MTQNVFFFFLTHCSRLIQSQKEREQQNKVPPSNTINSLSISKKEKKKKKKEMHCANPKNAKRWLDTWRFVFCFCTFEVIKCSGFKQNTTMRVGLDSIFTNF